VWRLDEDRSTLTITCHNIHGIKIARAETHIVMEAGGVVLVPTGEDIDMIHYVISDHICTLTSAMLLTIASDLGVVLSRSDKRTPRWSIIDAIMKKMGYSQDAIDLKHIEFKDMNGKVVTWSLGGGSGGGGGKGGGGQSIWSRRCAQP
jgi:hypothetical protein